MRWLPWALLPFVLVGGAALGYAAHTGTSRTTTVVQTQSRSAPLHKLRVVIEGPGYTCVLSSISSDTVILRKPGPGSGGAVIAVSDSAAFNKSGCGWVVTFSINPQLGFFLVSDEDQQLDWGPFNTRQVAQRDWTVRVADNG